MRPAKLMFITRTAYGNCRAWWVRFQSNVRTRRGTTRRVVSKSFADSIHGGKAKALAAAIEWRDAMLLEFPKPVDRYYKSYPRPPGTGYVRRDVKTQIHKRTGAKKVYPVWMGWFRMADGRATTTNYSIPKWGDETARRICESWLATLTRDFRKRGTKRSRS